MFADDKSIENMQQLFIEFKKYLELQKEYTKLEVTEKLSKLLSTLLLVLLVVILGVVVLFHLSFTLVYILAPLVGGLMMSFALITCFHILLIVLLVLFRKKLIIDPTVKHRPEKSHAATRNTTPERNHDWAYTRNFCSAGTSYQQGKCHDESIQHGYGCF